MDSFNQENTNILIMHFLEGNASEAERSQLEQWVSFSNENKKYYQQIKNLWEISDKRNFKNDILPDAALDNILKKISREPGKRGFLINLQKIAAILILPLAIAGYLIGKKADGFQGLKSIAYNEVYASIGTRSTLTLSDGSKVWLNSGSKLRYPDKFTSKNRIVYLTGEAYFEVNSDINRPFIVKTKKINVKATGTHFNVQAMDSDREVKVSLLSGKVVVNKIDNKKELTVANLLPSQMLTYNIVTGRAQTFTGDLYEFIAWKDGRLIFRNRPMSEVIKKISQQYNVEIELRGKELQDYRYRATFEEESLNEILKLLKMSSPIKYAEVKREHLLNGTFTKRKIIITPL